MLAFEPSQGGRTLQALAVAEKLSNQDRTAGPLAARDGLAALDDGIQMLAPGFIARASGRGSLDLAPAELGTQAELGRLPSRTEQTRHSTRRSDSTERH
jgi:hypothetical protein